VSPQNSSARRRSGSRIVYAGGAVLWRPADRKSAKGRKDARDAKGGPQVAVIHRPRYDDWSLPKGKVDRGETLPVAAAREVLEETGHRAVLGRRLVTVSYPIDSGVKKVYYWAARSTGGKFTPGNEVDELVWLPVAEAMKKLQYAQDRKVLRLFAKHPADTHTVLVVRHGTAGSKARYHGDDTKRPLDKKGRAQAEALVAQLLPFGATSVYAADRVRCQQTVQPLAEELGVRIRNETSLTEEAYAKNPNAAETGCCRSPHALAHR
jgi:8-oxo-dGTP pyrophosphatase MutT (NUDIX family)